MTYWLAQQSSTAEVRIQFPGGQILHKLVNSDIVNLLLKTIDWRDRIPYFAIFVVRSANYVSAESLGLRERISSSSFYEQLADYYSHVFSLIHPADEFYLKEMRTWGQCNVS